MGARLTQAKDSHIPLITPSSLRNKQEVREGKIRLQRLVRALGKREDKMKLGSNPELGEESSKPCQLGQKHHSSSAQCGLGFSSSRAILLGVCPQCVNVAPADVITQQMPHLSEDPTPVLALCIPREWHLHQRASKARKGWNGRGGPGQCLLVGTCTFSCGQRGK